MHTTQEHLSIADTFDDILLLKDGGGALVLQVSAVNFGLLSDREQMAIIYSFAQMLNSLSFTIQIVILSERLNISSYLELLDKARKAQTNPLLSQMIGQYKTFVQSTIKENEVLDKKFYLVIPLFALELGLTASRTLLEQKIKTTLLPRRDQIIRQLSRVGLRATQLPRQKLIEVFYNIYNGETMEKPVEESVDPAALSVRLKNPVAQTTTHPSTQEESKPSGESFRLPSAGPSQVSSPKPPTPIQSEPTITQSAKTHPFVVEELSE